jgi:hypothetical protein
MEREVWYRRRGPPVIQRGFVRSRHESACAAGAYAIVVPVRRRELGASVEAGVQRGQRSPWRSVELGRLA